MPNTVFNALIMPKSDTTHLPAVRSSSQGESNKSLRIRVKKIDENLMFFGTLISCVLPQAWLVSRLWRSEIDRSMSIDDIENTKVIGLEGNELQAILAPAVPVNPDVCLLTDSPFRILRVSIYSTSYLVI
jgi:hypothetical protein